MGNAYLFTECEHCKRLTEVEHSFIVHGSHGLEKLTELRQQKVPIGDIMRSFCQYCGGYVGLEATECRCGHLERKEIY